MGMDEENVKVFPANWGGTASKPCDSCKSAAAIIFCRHDSAFLCLGCDSKIHSSTRHQRVWMCEVCEQAPAAVTCKADAAALCVTCDSDIHSANPLARRHDRVPVEPFFDSAESLLKFSAAGTANIAAGINYLVPTNDEAEVEAASWILPNLNITKVDESVKIGGDMFFSDFDHLLELDYINTIDDANFKKHNHHQQQQHSHGSDSVVPVQQFSNNNNNNNNNTHNLNHHQQLSETCFEIDFCKSKLTPYNYFTTTTQPKQHGHVSTSISSSSLDVGVVPDGSVMNSSGSGGGCGGVDQLVGLDREARVLRYREKRKNRRFEKTIRYASRKAYAETRPRIKGRFAKRTETEMEMETDVDRLFVPVGSAAYMADTGYGVVPSF